MRQAIDCRSDNTSATEKLIVCLTGFGFACATFFLALLVLVPTTGSLAAAFHFPETLTISLVLLEIFGLTSVAGLLGVEVAAKEFDTDSGS